MNTTPIVSKVWSFCTTLRDDGVSYGDYLEQLTYLIFLKMADEYANPPYNRDVGIPIRIQLEELEVKERRRTRRPLHRAASSTRHKDGHAGADLHQGPKQDPGPG